MIHSHEIRLSRTNPGCLLVGVPPGLREYRQRLESFRKFDARRDEGRFNAVIGITGRVTIVAVKIAIWQRDV